MPSKYILPLLLVLQVIVLQLLSFFPEWIDTHYSNGFYLWISRFWRIALGSITFSVGDCLYGILITLLVRWFWRKRKTWKISRKDNVLQLVSYLSVFYFFFYISWAVNYARLPLFEQMNIKRDYTDKDLLVFTQKLIAKTNAVQYQITKNEAAKIVFPYTQEQVFQKNLNGYDNLSQQYPNLKYEHLSIKKSLFSLPLTYMGFAGYLNPFTNEAQVNDRLPMYAFPTTASHEMAHQLGYASESECNFIGFLASIKNDDLYFQYSGYAFALRYCLHNWEIRNPSIRKQLLKTIHPGILKNYQESEDFWRQYETFIETGFKVFYDNYLKFNNQKDGLESYSKFVNLLVNYYQDKSL
ncbi:DUF3810 domain-containing protein [Flavobacterium sp. CYK-4]|uniref:DUF3810 domain-containing protein n=1 Tax=Flavobacterium lotistagni TaxID=2709660 RepID=UPI00140B512A|nr:DUF3810 domain-containing protein [Flavobacterium lotistagni]NHM06991.1 DUF3810 domain-containing protein [Flavobacterium lotistagni]